MEKIKSILEQGTYASMSKETMLDVAVQEFKKFDDDNLKIEYLTECFKKVEKESMSMTPEKCARLLVESGTFEGGQ